MNQHHICLDISGAVRATPTALGSGHNLIQWCESCEGSKMSLILQDMEKHKARWHREQADRQRSREAAEKAQAAAEKTRARERAKAEDALTRCGG